MSREASSLWGLISGSVFFFCFIQLSITYLCLVYLQRCFINLTRSPGPKTISQVLGLFSKSLEPVFDVWGPKCVAQGQWFDVQNSSPGPGSGFDVPGTILNFLGHFFELLGPVAQFRVIFLKFMEAFTKLGKCSRTSFIFRN